jgi:hypothetical protein
MTKRYLHKRVVSVDVRLTSRTCRNQLLDVCANNNNRDALPCCENDEFVAVLKGFSNPVGAVGADRKLNCLAFRYGTVREGSAPP